MRLFGIAWLFLFSISSVCVQIQCGPTKANEEVDNYLENNETTDSVAGSPTTVPKSQEPTISDERESSNLTTTDMKTDLCQSLRSLLYQVNVFLLRRIVDQFRNLQQIVIESPKKQWTVDVGQGDLISITKVSQKQNDTATFDISLKTAENYNVSNETTFPKGGNPVARKMKMSMQKMLPYIIVPGFIMAGIMPWLMPGIKIMVMGVSMMNQMAFSMSLMGLIRSYIFDSDPSEHVVYVNHGYKNKPIANYLNNNNNNIDNNYHNEHYYNGNSNYIDNNRRKVLVKR